LEIDSLDKFLKILELYDFLVRELEFDLNFLSFYDKFEATLLLLNEIAFSIIGSVFLIDSDLMDTLS